MVPGKELLYGRAWFHGCLAFADAQTAPHEADEIVAIVSARTWAEAAAVRTRYVRNPVTSMFEDEDPYDLGIDPDRPFDPFRLGAVADGDWPPMVTCRALFLLPHEIVERFGRVVTTDFNGDYVDIPVQAESAVVTALERCGYAVRRDDNLINVLDGRRFNPIAGSTPAT